MKKILAVVCLLLGTTLINAQEKKSKIHLFGELTPFLNLNSGDIPYSSRNYLSQKTTMGSCLGFGIAIAPENPIRFTSALGLRYDPQALTINTGEEQFEFSQNNLSLYWKLLLGFKFNASKGNAILINVGFNNTVSFNNKREENGLLTQPYQDPLTGETLNNLVGIYSVNFGDSRSTSAQEFLLLFTYHALFQAGFETTNLLPNHRRCGVLLEFSSKLFPGNSDSPNNGNSAVFYKIDNNRLQVGSQKFNDHYSTFGVNFYVDIF